jgi:ParB family chromosome partitioning protein
MTKVVSVNPFKCRMWDFHDRLDDSITENTCRMEIESFQQHGQLVPVLGRLLRQDLDHEVELIFGARRLFVARHINVSLLVDLREMTDREAIVAMDIENRQRLDISPYERGLSYARWLRVGQFQTQDELARSLQVSSSQVSRLLRLARLPSVLLNAFGCATDICEGWGLDLLDALDDPTRRQRILTKARAIADLEPRPPAREVYRQLLVASVAGRKLRASPRDKVVNDSIGDPLFRVRQQSKTVALLLPVEKISGRSLDKICEAIVGILQAAGMQRDPVSVNLNKLS